MLGTRRPPARAGPVARTGAARAPATGSVSCSSPCLHCSNVCSICQAEIAMRYRSALPATALRPDRCAGWLTDACPRQPVCSTAERLALRSLVHCLVGRSLDGLPTRLGDRVLVPELRMVVPAVVVQFGLPGEPQFALRALMDGHRQPPPAGSACREAVPPQ